MIVRRFLPLFVLLFLARAAPARAYDANDVGIFTVGYESLSFPDGMMWNGHTPVRNVDSPGLEVSGGRIRFGGLFRLMEYSGTVRFLATTADAKAFVASAHFGIGPFLPLNGRLVGLSPELQLDVGLRVGVGCGMEMGAPVPTNPEGSRRWDGAVDPYVPFTGVLRLRAARYFLEVAYGRELHVLSLIVNDTPLASPSSLVAELGLSW